MGINREKAIGVFDSGLGGLTVAREIFKQLPHEKVVYFGDTARVPYGTKSKETIVRFSHDNAALLVKHKVKVIVVACNSSSSYALESLKKKFRIPIIGVITPGARKAAFSTSNNRIGVIATAATIKSARYENMVKSFNLKAQVFSVATPLFVPLVEEGWLESKVTRAVAQEYLQPLKSKKIDTLVLGCTHYPLLKNVLQKVMGNQVTLIDSAKEVALEVREVLGREGLLVKRKGEKVHRFLISDRPQAFEKIAQKFLGRKIPKVQKIVQS